MSRGHNSTFSHSSTMPVDQQALWDWHLREGAFERLTPPWQDVRVLEKPLGLAPGNEVRLQLRIGPLRKAWDARIESVDPPVEFVDTQIRGPFASWRHSHRMQARDDSSSQLMDSVEYRLPHGGGLLPFIRGLGRAEMERLFRFRHERLRMDLQRGIGSLPGKGKIVLVTGISGLIGSRLRPFLQTAGYTVRGLSRHPVGKGQFAWDPQRGYIDPAALEDVDAILHLAGENIAGGRWTRKRRERILDSRIHSTRCIVDAIGGMDRPPVLVSASGVNFYQPGGDVLDEAAPSGSGFLANVCRRWETEAMAAAEQGCRVVLIRTGVVLDPAGGALAKMLPAYRMGLGGPIGSGEQGFPWIAIDDLLDIYERSIRDPELAGPLNAVAPDIISQAHFNKALSATLRRPGIVPLPATVIELLFGQMGRETLLQDLRIQPGQLEKAQHAFRFSRIEDALPFLLGRSAFHL